MSTTTQAVAAVTSAHPPQPRARPAGQRQHRPWLTYSLLTFLSLVWLFPLLYAVMQSFRDYDYTSQFGYVSLGGWTLQNYTEAWDRGNFAQGFINSLIITVPAVLLSLFLASCFAFVLSRYSFKFNLTLLALFTAANLLPPQALLVPVFRMYLALPVPEWLSETGNLLNTHLGVILVNVAFQTGFCTFVLSNYMKTLPREMYEAAEVDGAGTARQFFQLTLPLVKPALAALAVLEVTWIYNEFFWATVLLQDGSKFPITSSINNLRGQFFTDVNLVAAGSVIIAIPTLIVFFVLRKQFVSGLTLGATKG
jgi:multiple sugar transport system permease protein